MKLWSFLGLHTPAKLETMVTFKYCSCQQHVNSKGFTPLDNGRLGNVYDHTIHISLHEIIKSQVSHNSKTMVLTNSHFEPL